jgi:helix-turn-helix protein
MARCWELKLPPSQKFVLLVFADHCNDEGTNSYPSLGQVVRKTGLGVSAVKNSVRALKASGLLAPYSCLKGGRSRAVHYRVCPEKGSPADPLIPKGVTWQPPLKTERGHLVAERGHLATPESLEPPVEAAAAAKSSPKSNLEAWTFIGALEPFGHRPFRKQWQRFFESRKPTDPVALVMERCAVHCQDNRIVVPGDFFALKRKAEKRPTPASVSRGIPTLERDYAKK